MSPSCLYRTSASGMRASVKSWKQWKGCCVVPRREAPTHLHGFEGQLACSASASPVLTSMFSSALKSAATFRVTSQHAVSLHWDQAAPTCPWVWLTTRYLRKKGWSPCRFFMPGCTLFSRVILSVSVLTYRLYEAHIAVSPSSLLPAVRTEDGNCWMKTGQITMPPGSEAACLRGHLFKTSPFSNYILRISHLHFSSL